MKIVLMAPFGLRPKGTVLARMIPLAVGLQQRGHEVVIVAPPYTNPESSGTTEVVRGVPVKNIVLGPKHKALAAPFLAWRLFRAALDEKPDLVHLFKPKGYGGLSAMLQLCSERLGIRMPPLFLDTDDWEGKGGMNDQLQYSAAERQLYAFQEQWLPQRVRGVTVASRMLEELHLQMGIARERLLYLPNCVDDSPAGDGDKIRRRLGIAPEAPVLLLYTRFFEFSQEKLHLIFAEARRRVPGVRFLVVGKGRQGEEAELLQAAKADGFEDALVMAGWIEPMELPDYLAAADLAIYPFADTLLNRCKCPAKLTELLRAGVPVVADAVGQIKEYIVPERGGVLCDPDDWQGMVERTVELLNDPVPREALGKEGRRYLLEQFRWNMFAEKLELFYKISD
ncbi:glycosyltransferase family 4 protein [Geomonas paludis]|uniref:Glycosyl transferase n=1 Tax=Geomonas paludis TaxID=2740185 RepID=A0A6V8N217_9BACT|nr:glycosyltransferase family 4 protein [Geomonas paludis]UPU36780.1 glycosyltransferase family 4 protein [Geomonas paludis]GFO66044.1 glycosyl transferase [Geomonas paludis]